MSTHDPDAIERVAQAIYDSRDARVRHNTDEPFAWETMPDFVQDSYREDARAALRAIDDLYDDGGERP
jgi:hypothetical protein